MTAVLTRHEAAATADAPVAVYLRIDDGVAVEVGGGDNAGQCLADEGFHGCQAALGEIVLKADDKVVDDAVAILHDSSTNLHVAAAQLDELQCVAPGLDAADAAQFDALAVGAGEHGVRGHLVDVAQGDGLHGSAAVARDGQPSAHGSLGRHGETLNGVDGRDGIGTGEVGTHGRQPHVGDVGRHLGYDGYLHAVLHIGGVGGHQFWVLSHVAAHAGQSHLRTREVQFHGIAARVLSHTGQFDPFFLKLPHD